MISFKQCSKCEVHNGCSKPSPHALWPPGGGGMMSGFEITSTKEGVHFKEQ